jgi:uncharacterized lipoprotein YajG
MRSPVVLLVVLMAAACLAACAESPVVQQATFNARQDPMRADTMVAVRARRQRPRCRPGR